MPSRLSLRGKTGCRSSRAGLARRRIELCLASMIVALCIFVPAVALAHSGRTDANGGHNDYINGGYHYHNGGSASPVSGGGGSSGSSSGGSCWPFLVVGGVIAVVALSRKK